MGVWKTRKLTKMLTVKGWLIKFQRGTRTLSGSRPVANWVIFYQ